MIRTHILLAPFFFSGCCCVFSFGIPGICCPLIPTSPVLCRIIERASGEREGAASAWMGDHYVDAMGKESSIGRNDRGNGQHLRGCWRASFIPIHPGAKIVSIIYWTIVLLLIHRYT
ncbi:uncharacterized protein BT62DRAFT_286169 [Guyanagaster necrorhizus]|uniref:Secreted protein n=1 Tax=Guyanagaster necrorhizus TaxID=856835 RepID=A0A9P7W3W3_9AGAR|nr:uncharacterized protein BT62DRAFT_286169 [Guyanagaster necrorhizus MCA 3950]KAG7452162.1 hypothetical protein BT62DRAFT_286169 [Guyanagaster necrorhizus MCA 3950]